MKSKSWQHRRVVGTHEREDYNRKRMGRKKVINTHLHTYTPNVGRNFITITIIHCFGVVVAALEEVNHFHPAGGRLITLAEVPPLQAGIVTVMRT